MKKFIQSYSLAFRYVFKDGTNFLLAMIPIGLGLSLYALVGGWLFGSVLNSGQKWLEGQIASQQWGSVIYYIALTLLTILFFLVINWTFVLLVTLIASPFNDLLSRRIDSIHRGIEAEKMHKMLAQMSTGLVKILWNEVKKIVVIFVLVTLSFILSFIPVLVPISFLLSALILSAGYLDYSWSRYDLPSKQCFSSLKHCWIPYSVVGFSYMLLLSIPLINLLSIPLAVTQYTILFVDNSPELLEEV